MKKKKKANWMLEQTLEIAKKGTGAEGRKANQNLRKESTQGFRELLEERSSSICKGTEDGKQGKSFKGSQQEAPTSSWCAKRGQWTVTYSKKSKDGEEYNGILCSRHVNIQDCLENPPYFYKNPES